MKMNDINSTRICTNRFDYYTKEDVVNSLTDGLKMIMIYKDSKPLIELYYYDEKLLDEDLLKLDKRFFPKKIVNGVEEIDYEY